MRELLDKVTVPVDDLVNKLWQGTPSQSGLGLLQIGPMAMLDTNADRKLNAADVDPEDPDTADLAQVNLDLRLLNDGMRQRVIALAHRFDPDNNGFNVEESQRFMVHLLESMESGMEFPEDNGILTTQQYLEQYEQMINHGLPATAAPPKGERER